MSNNNKEFKAFEKRLTTILNSSSTAESWGDLLPLTKEINQLLEKNKTEFNFSQLPNKHILAKRLAQCLNPECPGGIHEVVIDIYNVLLENIMEKNEYKLEENLGIYSCGIFPFFSYASIQNKTKFLEKIINSCFLNFDKNELSICLPGLLSSLIPGLDDNDDKTTQLIYQIFDKIKKKITPRIFYGVYWAILLRNKSLRPSGMKYLYEKITKYSDIQNMDENQKNEIIKNEYPDINILVVNSLCEIIEEKDIFTVRLGMDFIITRLPLTKKNTILNDEAKITLIMSALKLLIKNESSTARRLNDWLLGINNEEDFNIEDQDSIYKMDLISQAFKNMLNTKNWKNFNILKDYIKIIDQLFSQQTEFVDFILPKIAYELILCYVNYWQTELNLSENAQKNETINKLKNFFAKDNNYIECLWKSIANHLEDVNTKNEIGFINEEYYNVKKIDTLINSILNPLKFCFLFIDLNSNIDRAKYYIPIIKNLLQFMTKLNIDKRESILKIRHIIVLILVFTKSLQEKSSNNEILRNSISTDSNKNLSESFIRKPSLFTQLSEETDKTDINEIYFILEETLYNNLLTHIDETTIKNLTEAVKNYQKFYINLLIKVFEIPKNSQITKIEIKVFKHSTELMIRLQEYAQDIEIPEWIGFLEKIIFNSNVLLSLEAIDCLLNLNLSFFNEKQTYNKIKENFLNEKIGDKGIIDEIELNNIIKKTGINDNCHELLIGKLYTMLTEQSYQKRCIDLLVKISKIDEKKFITILTNTFSIKDSTEESVKRFSNFWKLLNENYSNYNFFKNGECLFQMVDFLDDNNPLLRHLSKSWLDQSSKQFSKILDPLILIFLDNSIKFTENNNNYIIEKEYDIPKIMSTFHRLKSIILNSDIMYYMVKKTPNIKILDIFNNHKQYTLMDNISDVYLNILIAISLKFTQGQCTEKLSKNFQKNNYSINATSCEFLEFLLSHVNETEILMKIAIKINLPILILLDNAIEKNNEVMQVQLLSVLKVLYFSTKSVHLKYNEDAFKLFGNKSLINCLTKGMTSDYFFVRENFINFSQECFKVLKNVFNTPQSDNLYYDIGEKFISELIFYLSKRIKIDRKGRKDTERFSHFDTKNNANSIIFKNYLEEYKEYKTFDESDVLLLLKGIREVVLKFLCNNNSVNGSWVEYKKLLIKNNKNTNDFLSGIFNTDNDKNNIQSNLYKKQISNLLNVLLLTWINHSDKYEPYDYCLNPNGILPQKSINKLLFNDVDIKNGIDYVNDNPIKIILRQIGFNLFTTNSVEFIKTLILIWCQGSSFKLKPIDVCTDFQYKITIIEFLISLNIPLNIILYCVNIILQKIIKNEPGKKRYIKDPNTKNIKTPYKTSLFEAKLCHFLYSYISLNPFINSNFVTYRGDPTKYEIVESWKEMINFITTLMNDTKIIYTFSWIYELLDLTLYKFPINKIENAEIKTNLINIFSIITNKLTDSVFYDKTDSKIFGDDNLLVLPILPHVYKNMLQEVEISGEKKLSYLYNKGGENSSNQVELNQKNNNINSNNENIEKSLPKIPGKVYDFYNLYYSTAKICSDNTEKSFTPPMDLLNIIYRKLSFITLKENFYNILYNIYGDLNSLKKYITDILKGLINILKQNSQEKNNDKLFFAEYASDFLLSLMKDSTELVTICGKNIFMDYLNSPNFFATTPKILRNFRKLISLSVEYYPEILNDLIKNINNGFLFLKGSDEDKIKTLRRVSFVIYSCEKDTFQKDFDIIKTKARDFLSGYSDNKLEGEVFLMMRILFLRFSHEGLMKMIKDLWPIIFTELIQNIQDETRNKHVNVLIESFKFIELLSLANVEEFSLYQWIFILDTFNMKNLDTRNPESLLSILLKNESKIFKPIAVDILKDGDMSVTDELLEGKHKSKSELYVCPENESIEELRKNVKGFFYAIRDMNEYKVDINYEQIEDVIEKDFIEDINKIDNKESKDFKDLKNILNIFNINKWTY